MKPNCRDIHLADQVQEVTHVIKLRCLFLVSFFFFPFFLSSMNEVLKQLPTLKVQKRQENCYLYYRGFSGFGVR